MPQPHEYFYPVVHEIPRLQQLTSQERLDLLYETNLRYYMVQLALFEYVEKPREL